jgi:hypothetical protein
MEGTRIRLMLSAQIIIQQLHAKIQHAGISMQLHEGYGAVGWVARYRDHMAVGTDKPSQIYIKLGRELDEFTIGYTVDIHPSFTWLSSPASLLSNYFAHYVLATGAPETNYPSELVGRQAIRTCHCISPFGRQDLISLARLPTFPYLLSQLPPIFPLLCSLFLSLSHRTSTSPRSEFCCILCIEFNLGNLDLVHIFFHFSFY